MHLNKTPLNELLTNQNYKDVKELYDKQLKISSINRTLMISNTIFGKD